MSAKIRPNEPCPCASGRKYKKCCGGPNAAPTGGLPHTQADRASAFEKLDLFIEQLWEDEEEDAFDEMWGRYYERQDELPPELIRLSNEVHEMWFILDRELDDGTRVVDHFLRQAELTRGERGFVEGLRRTTMRLYEVQDTVPGSSITLRDLLEGTVVTVAERTASRTISRHECVATRIIGRGASGRPEIERGVLHIPALIRDGVLRALKEDREDLLRAEPTATRDDFYRTTPPLFHDAWLSSIFEPAVPKLANTDGEEMILTRVSFHVDDAGALARALDGAEGDGISRGSGEAWLWTGGNANGSPVSLATIALRDDILTVEANSVERGARARELVERLCAGSVRHRGTTHEDVRRKVMESVTATALGRESAPALRQREPLDPDVAEALVAEHYARHYRAWIDEPVPAIDDMTPREAAKRPELRARVADLIRGIEGLYERALKQGEPAYDPSWMWAELGLAAEPDPANPPPLAHERVAERIAGSAEAARAAAERLRARLGGAGADKETIGGAELERDLELQRFLRRERGSGNDAGTEGALAAPYMPSMVNFELHRRKVFWVDEALSYMLEGTDLDVGGREVRPPFPSFAVAFTDRHALSLGERLLSRREADPLRGQILRVLTVYVTERGAEGGRTLELVYALDALGADLPSLVRYEVPADDDASLQAFLEAVAPRPIVEPEVRDASPARGLLRLVLNAILYATSAGVTPEVRTVTSRRPRTRPAGAPPVSDSVFFLGGKIDVRRVRQIQELARAPNGGVLLARFMVRGHWRRPSKNWTDQRLRWIEPYWKGPDMAAVIEKAYRLRP